MQRTLFYLPHDLFGVPLLGVGWLLLLLILGFAFWVFRIYRDPQRNLIAELTQNGFIWVVAAAILLFILPAVEIRSLSGEPIGVAVRGYGVFLLLGVASGVALALHRAAKAGIPSDDIIALTMWLFIGGIGGARLFYIIEYRQDFFTGELISTVRKMLDFTRGGLVVYGSIIGGTIAMFAFVYRSWSVGKAQLTAQKQKSNPQSKHHPSFVTSFLKMGDVVIPCLFLGIFFGRLGCLMNGCCYGGRCEDSAWALYFPPGSPVYSEQITSGELLGLQLDTAQPDGRFSNDQVAGPITGGFVREVEPNSPADRQGIKPGSFVSQIYSRQPDEDNVQQAIAEDDSSQFSVVAVVDARQVVWTADELPRRARAVRPAQVISSVSGLLICGLLLVLSATFNLPHGVLMATGFAVYAVARFGEEMVRTDEPGQFGTQLSISQWISLLIFPIALSAIGYVYWKRPASQLAPSDLQDAAQADPQNANSGTGGSS